SWFFSFLFWVCSQVELELRAQVRRFIELTGHLPHHMDGHQHVHVLPDVREVFAQVLSDVRIPFTRVPMEPGLHSCPWVPAHLHTFYMEVEKDALDSIPVFKHHGIRSNLRILNIPEDNQDPTTFISKLLKDAMGDDIFPSPPELERAHRTAEPKPTAGHPPRPFILAFHRYQEKEVALRWSRQHEVNHQGTTLRISPDLSIALAKKRSTFNDVKEALCQRGVSFRLLLVVLKLHLREKST
uniref:Carbohydrate deacetylase n=1 Tax=Xiphophorus couchianus TaxID=32473 RepID=A0A3B5MG95_9TELE